MLLSLNCFLIFVFFTANRKDWPPHMQKNVARFHVGWAAASATIWLPTLFPLLDEVF